MLIYQYFKTFQPMAQGNRMPGPAQYMGMTNTNQATQYLNQQPVQYTNWNNTIMYAPQNPRAPSPAMQPTSQAPLQKRQKNILSIVDPNTNKDITSEILHTTPNQPGSTRSTPPSDTGSGSRSTPVGVSYTLLGSVH